LRAVLLVRGGDDRRQQLTQRIDRQVHLGALAPLVPIVASAPATLWAPACCALPWCAMLNTDGFHSAPSLSFL
jgi:hypothetical protein